jgi:multicomponent Na+:H+ antiporter subunit F
MILLSLAVLVVNMIVILAKILTTKSAYEKVMILNLFTSNIVAFIVLFSLFTPSNMVIDIALIYILISFIAVIAFLRFFSKEQNL